MHCVLAHFVQFHIVIFFIFFLWICFIFLVCRLLSSSFILLFSIPFTTICFSQLYPLFYSFQLYFSDHFSLKLHTKTLIFGSLGKSNVLCLKFYNGKLALSSICSVLFNLSLLHFFIIIIPKNCFIFCVLCCAHCSVHVHNSFRFLFLAFYA